MGRFKRLGVTYMVGLDSTAFSLLTCQMSGIMLGISVECTNLSIMSLHMASSACQSQGGWTAYMWLRA